jgi:hypothetical protein
VGVNRNQSIVGSAASQSSGTRVQSTLHLGPGRGVETGVKTAIGSLVRGLEVPSLTFLVFVVLYEEIPCQIGILRHLGVVSRDSVVDVGALIISSFDEQSLVTSEGKTSGKGTVRKLDIERVCPCDDIRTLRQHQTQQRHIRIQ